MAVRGRAALLAALLACATASAHAGAIAGHIGGDVAAAVAAAASGAQFEARGDDGEAQLQRGAKATVTAASPAASVARAGLEALPPNPDRRGERATTSTPWLEAVLARPRRAPTYTANSCALPTSKALCSRCNAKGGCAASRARTCTDANFDASFDYNCCADGGADCNEQLTTVDGGNSATTREPRTFGRTRNRTRTLAHWDLRQASCARVLRRGCLRARPGRRQPWCRCRC